MNLTGARALVTGGAGFIGSHVVDQLLERGASVTVLDNLITGRTRNLEAVRNHIEVVEGDIRDRGLVEEVVRGRDLIFHFAANADVPKSVEEPAYDFETNAGGTFNLLAACRSSDVRRIIYASTAAVYGTPQYTPMDEQHPCRPVSPYGASKYAGERLGFAFRETYGLPFTAFRIFNTFGPRQPRYVMYDLFRKLQNDSRTLEVLGTGEQVRDYCYVADTAKAFVDVSADDITEGEVYNLSGGRSISIRNLVALILEAHGSNGTKVYYTGKSWPGDIVHLEADISKIRTFGFAPTVGLEEGLGIFAKWLKVH